MSKPTKPKNAYNRSFRGLPVEDATAPVFIQPSREDIDSGIPGDPCNCMYANAFKRLYNSHNVFIFSEIAYIEMLNSKGEHIMKRYFIKGDAHKLRQAFDEGIPIPAHGVSFDIPTGSKSLSGKHAYDQKRKQAGKPMGGRGPSLTGKKFLPPLEGTLHRRSGSGLVHFNGTGSETAIESRDKKTHAKASS